MFQKETVMVIPVRWKDTNAASKVKGPVRCHKCQLICVDAKHYLSHKCGIEVNQLVVRRGQ
jgi:hypothetical protein